LCGFRTQTFHGLVDAAARVVAGLG
jgi:hypothetical protein